MAEIKTLSIDLETRSSIDLGKCGVYKYASSPDFDILLFGVSVNGGSVEVYDLACGDTVPREITLNTFALMGLVSIMCRITLIRLLGNVL